VSVAWWTQPTESTSIALLQGKEIIPIVPLEMNLDLKKDYRGPALLTLLRKKTTDPKTPPAVKTDSKNKPIKERPEDWEILTTVSLPDAAEVGILLFMNQQKICEGRAFDYDIRRFPYGSMRLVNLTKLTLHGQINQAAFQVAPEANEPLPINFHDRVVSHLEISAQTANQSNLPILATKLVGHANHRTLIFMLQGSGKNLDDTPTFESRSIDTIQPVVAPEPPGPEAKKKTK
jgi:hypothetical protein